LVPIPTFPIRLFRIKGKLLAMTHGLSSTLTKEENVFISK
jgi:hypothetical protein